MDCYKPLSKIKVFKMDCQKNTTHNIRHEKHTIKNKIDKNWKKIETTYCLGCKDYTHNYKPEEVEMRNNVLREKSNNIACK